MFRKKEKICALKAVAYSLLMILGLCPVVQAETPARGESYKIWCGNGGTYLALAGDVVEHGYTKSKAGVFVLIQSGSNYKIKAPENGPPY